LAGSLTFGRLAPGASTTGGSGGSPAGPAGGGKKLKKKKKQQQQPQGASASASMVGGGADPTTPGTLTGSLDPTLYPESYSQYRFDRNDGYLGKEVDRDTVQGAIDDSLVPVGSLPFHRPVEETGFGLDRGFSGILQDHVVPIDQEFSSLKVSGAVQAAGQRGSAGSAG
jgi:hypothetical protein